MKNLSNEQAKATKQNGGKMPEKSPETFGLLTYAWVFGLSIAGGIVAFLRKVRAGHTRVFNVVEFFGECATSAFAGVITFYMCEWSNFNPLATAAMVGISGHMGSRAIFQLESFLTNTFPRSLPKQEDGE